jgi:hypothetical protein
VSSRQAPPKYRTIVADPPWPLKWRMSPGIGTKHLSYATMPIAEIAALLLYVFNDVQRIV